MFLIREHLDQNKMSNIFLISCILSLMCLLLSPQAQRHLLSSRVRPSLCGFFKGCWCHWGAGVHPWGQSQPTQRVQAQCGGGEPGFRGTWDDLRDLGCIVRLGNSEEKKKKKKLTTVNTIGSMNDYFSKILCPRMNGIKFPPQETHQGSQNYNSSELH